MKRKNGKEKRNTRERGGREAGEEKEDEKGAVHYYDYTTAGRV